MKPILLKIYLDKGTDISGYLCSFSLHAKVSGTLGGSFFAFSENIYC